MKLPVVVNSNNNYKWLKTHVRAIGFSSGKPIDISGNLMISENQIEDQARSQRVEFRVRTTIERRVADIVDKQGKH